jgi:hypothetical protein
MLPKYLIDITCTKVYENLRLHLQDRDKMLMITVTAVKNLVSYMLTDFCPSRGFPLVSLTWRNLPACTHAGSCTQSIVSLESYFMLLGCLSYLAGKELQSVCVHLPVVDISKRYLSNTQHGCNILFIWMPFIVQCNDLSLPVRHVALCQIRVDKIR